MLKFQHGIILGGKLKTAKFGLLIGILSVSTTALAEWKVILKNEDATVYVETAKIKRIGNLTNAWLLDDLTSPEKAGKRSYKFTKSKMSFDCNNERTKTEYIVAYSGQMGAGEVVGSVESLEWKQVIPGTFGETVLNRICQS